MAENYYGITDTGRIRDNNEDAFIAQKVLGDRFLAACVIDGVGGYEGGEVAAAIARDTVLEYLKAPSEDLIGTMKAALITANERIYAERMKSEERSSMACVLTLALADTRNNQFYYAHVGDTRLYLLRDFSLVKVTKDHSFVGYLEDSGRLTEEAAMQHPKRNEINKALGFDPGIGLQADYIETGSSPFLPGDLLMLCSDGLTDLVNSQMMTAILGGKRSLVEKAQELVDAANNAGGKDNITVVLVQNTKRPVRQKAMRPVTVVQHTQEVNEEDKPDPERGEGDISPRTPRRKNRTVVIALSLLGLLFVVALLWSLWYFQGRDEEDGLVTQAGPSLQSLRWTEALSTLPGNTLLLTDTLFGPTIVIGDTLTVQKDSLHLQGTGQVLRADSAYRGPAFVVPEGCAYFLLENVVLQGFDVGIAAQRNVVHLKNVRFIDCAVPMQLQLSFPDGQPVSGRPKGTELFTSDSLPK